LPPSLRFTAFGSPQLKAEGYRYGRIYQGGIEYIPGLYSCDASKLSKEDASRAKNDNHENFDFLINLEN
jgi:hypothetical protein